jgi:hypothetical protein
VEIFATENMTGIPPGEFWAASGAQATGPGVFVTHVAGPLDPTDTLEVRINVINDAYSYMVSLTTAVDRDLLLNAGLQTPPYTLPANTWIAQPGLRHNAAGNRDFWVWTIKV